MNNITINDERESRWPTILEGISKNLTYSDIAGRLGVTRWLIQSDIRKMQRVKDPDLLLAFKAREEYQKANNNKYVKKLETRFYDMTGISIEEKMFQNMMHFYKAEIKKVIIAKNENSAIRNLPKKIRVNLMRNKIVTKSINQYEITAKAHNYLTENR